MPNNAATQAERDAMTFAGMEIEFDWTNDDWALAHLPHVRIATLILQRDHVALKEMMEGIAKEGLAPDMLENLTTTKHHLAALAEILDKALLRSFLVMERLGYSPDNSPPERPMH
jgi:hypothetical protein